jgi:hypothetical protein
MDAIHRKLDPRGRDPCARSVRTSPEITGHETSGRYPGREVPGAGTQPWWRIRRTVCSPSLLKFARRPAAKVDLVHGRQVIRNNRLSEPYANEYVPLRCDSILWLVFIAWRPTQANTIGIVQSFIQNTGSGLLRSTYVVALIIQRSAWKANSPKFAGTKI